MDTKLLRETFTLLAPQAADLAEDFYARVFYYGGDEVRDMFPVAMSGQRDRLLGALTRIIGSVDDLEGLSAYLTALGRDHRKFDVQPAHYDVIGRALLGTLRQFAGDAWTPQVHDTWAAAYALIAQVMQQGADADKDSSPWWDAVVTGREMRTPGIAVIQARLTRPMPYQPGQSAAVQFPERLPRVWRFYSPARPAGDGSLVFHVKVEAGGLLSTALGMHAGPGSRLRVGPPVGSLVLDTASDRPLLLVAGSTGLAPLEAILHQAAAMPPRPVSLFFGAPTPAGLYDRPLLDKLAAEHDWLTVTYAVSGDGGRDYAGERGTVVDVAAGGGDWTGRDAYVCGPPSMVRAAVTRLTALGVPAGRIRAEDFGWRDLWTSPCC